MSTNNLFDATESALGYLYQCRHALLLLIERSNLNPSVEMSIERFDDVAFEEKGNPIELIQTKHHLGLIRNLSDASSDLWKTLRVWSIGITKNTVELDDIVLVILTTATAAKGSIASLLRREGRDETTALKRLIEVATTSTNQENAPAYDSFLKLTSCQQQALIKAVYVSDEAPNIQDVLPKIKVQLAYVTPLQHLDKLVGALEGWWFNTVVHHLMSDDNSIISGQALHTKLDDLREQFRRDSLPIDFCFVEPPDLPNPNKDQRTFVKQLRVINSNEVTISKAICDHYKSSAQRSQWIREDLLLLEEWQKYEYKLTDEWERHYAWTLEELGEGSPAERESEAGRRMYRDLQEQSIHIRPDCTEPVIMRGSYHDLADNLKVGWHPRYKEIIEGEKQ